MKKASTNSLLIEELTDLLYEFNDINNLLFEVDCKNPDFFYFNFTKAVAFTAFTIERVSKTTDLPRESKEIIDSTFSDNYPEGYVDRGDLVYLVDKARDHAEHIKLAYSEETDRCTKAALKIIELYLQTSKYYIYGEYSIVK